MNLKLRIEDFLVESVECRQLSIRQMAGCYHDLTGDPVVGPSSHVGFVQFLVAHGILKPRDADLSAAWIGRYYEYLIQHEGAIRSGRAMRNLRRFWKWMVQNRYLPAQPMPGDLMIFQVDQPVEVRLSIASREIQGAKV